MDTRGQGQDGRPTSGTRQDRATGSRRGSPGAEGDLPLGDTGTDEGAERFGATQEIRQGELGRSIHRQEGIGDVFEATAGFDRRRGRASNDNPAELQLRRERDLGKTAEDERHHVGFTGPRSRRGDALGRVIEEDFVAHNREAVLQREAAEHIAIATADERAGWVGRIDAKDSAGLAVDAQRGGIDDPFAGELDELIRTQRHAFERGDDFEQRI